MDVETTEPGTPEIHSGRTLYPHLINLIVLLYKYKSFILSTQ